MTSWFDTEGQIINILHGILDNSYDLKDRITPGKLLYDGLGILGRMSADTHSFAHDAGAKHWSDKPHSYVRGAEKTLADAEEFLRKLQEVTIPKHVNKV